MNRWRPMARRPGYGQAGLVPVDDVERRRIAPDLVAAVGQDRHRLGHALGRQVDVDLVAVLRREPNGDVLAVAADRQPDVVAAAGPRRVDDVLDARVRALEGERRLVAAGHPADDLEVLAEHRQPLLHVRERHAERARPRSALKPQPRPRISRPPLIVSRVEAILAVIAGLRKVELMTPNPMSTRGTAAATAVWSVRQSKIDALGIPLGEDVLAGPQGVEAEALAERRDLEDALPRGDRLPALELVEVALGQQQADLHRGGGPSSSASLLHQDFTSKSPLHSVCGRKPPARP